VTVPDDGFDWTTLVPLLSGLLGLIGGLIAAQLTARSKLRELRSQFELAEEARRAEALARERVVYLNPLRLATIELHDRLEQSARMIEDGNALLERSLEELPAKRAEGYAVFADWANHAGHYALSSLYVTLVYLARASRIRSDVPFLDLGGAGDRALLDALGTVRQALGGEFGIWDGLQDSLGSYVVEESGSLKSYREFCTELADATTASWYRRVVEFHHDLHMKTREERRRMLDALAALAAFLAAPANA
jgi:hypothetical protein